VFQLSKTFRPSTPQLLFKTIETSRTRFFFCQHRISSESESHRAALAAHITAVSNRAGGTAQLFRGIESRSHVDVGNYLAAIVSVS
jgi:hypothetical protein